MRTLAITENITLDGSIEMLEDWLDPARRRRVVDGRTRDPERNRCGTSAAAGERASGGYFGHQSRATCSSAAGLKSSGRLTRPGGATGQHAVCGVEWGRVTTPARAVFPTPEGGLTNHPAGCFG